MSKFLSDSTLRSLATFLIVAAVAAVVCWVLLKVVKVSFQKLRKRNNGLHIRFLEQAVRLLIIVAAVVLTLSSLGGFSTVWQTFLGGTAIFSGVLAFAGQGVIKDILAGLMISINRPFEIGNRIELEDGTSGIVQDITMRHVVLQLIDTQRLIVPNSRLNEMKLKNFSYHTKTRAANFLFYIGYDSDVEQAMQVILEAIQASPYSVPGKKVNDRDEYAQVYFMAYEESSLRLATTVYYEATHPTEIVITDINLRVNKALKANGIEIPYNYMNVIQKQPQATVLQDQTEE